MKRVLIRALIALVTFAVGIGSSAVWTSRRSNAIPTPISSDDCASYYDADLLRKRLREDDDPQFFSAFQELPLYALPTCVDEAYSLTWIPSFHEPVLVRVWHSPDHAFMVAKALDSKGWSEFGNVKQANSRPSDFEWRDFRDLLNRTSYWELPSTGDEAIPQDGAVWLIDGIRTKQYHWVRRRVPDEPFAEICKHLIRLSGLETAHALYLP
jgi:hypothetical protein